MRKLYGKMTASQITIMGFLFIILIGALLLMLPAASADGSPTNPVDCLFTAASAVCITGLSTVNTLSHWSLFGQAVIMLLIQTGGLGFMCFVTIAFLILGKKITLRERGIMQESFNVNMNSGLVSYAKYIFKFAIAAELTGTALLCIRFIPQTGSAARGIWLALFHSVSAFCNAGFDLLGSDSLAPYSGDALVLFTVILLIVTGGLGFPVVQDIYELIKNVFIKKYRLRFALSRLKLHSEIVLVMTAALLLAGFFAVLAFEFFNNGTIGAMPFGKKLLNALFQSVTLRTAGFASFDQGGMRYGTKIVSLTLMFVGGSPAGTAGGVKTATTAVIFIASLSLIRGSADINVFGRRIETSVVQKALSVVIMMLSLIIVSVLILSVTESGLLTANGGKFELLDIVYETVSAAGTVGLTTGITPLLSVCGKMVIIVCMFIGRVGPIGLAISLSEMTIKSENRLKYPEGNVIVG